MKIGSTDELAIHAAEYLVGSSLNLVYLQGKKWFVCGALFFVAGLMVSLLKAGLTRKLYRMLRRLNLVTQQTRGN